MMYDPHWRGISDLSTYKADANACPIHIYLTIQIYFRIWMRPETDLRILESMCFFPAYVLVISDLCHMGGKIGIESLEPYVVNTV